jgi:hypothetical protein
MIALELHISSRGLTARRSATFDAASTPLHRRAGLPAAEECDKRRLLLDAHQPFRHFAEEEVDHDALTRDAGDQYVARHLPADGGA